MEVSIAVIFRFEEKRISAGEKMHPLFRILLRRIDALRSDYTEFVSQMKSAIPICNISVKCSPAACWESLEISLFRVETKIYNV